MTTHPKNILFILYNFPPDFGTAPIRNYQIACHLSPLFNNAFLLTKENADNAPFFKQIFKNRRTDYRYYIAKKSKSGYLSESLKRNFVSRFTIKLVNSFPFNLLFGEGGGTYLFRTVKKATELIRNENITHIYSSYRPFTDHAVSRYLKVKFPHLIWIADFRDLIVDPHYRQQFFPGWHTLFYNRFYKKADLLTTISEGFCKKLAATHKHALVTMNGIEEGLKFPEAMVSAIFSIVYTGSMFLDERNPHPVLKVLQDLLNSNQIDVARFRLIYAGKDIGYWNEIIESYELEDIFEYKGLLMRSASQELQQNANINLLLTIASDELDGVLTGKMIEYLQSGSNILAIIKHQIDPAIVDIFDDVNAGLVVSDADKEQIAIRQFILEKYNQWLDSGVVEKPINMHILMKRFAWQQTLEPLFNFINAG